MNVLHALAERDLLGFLDDVCRAHHVTRAEVCSRGRSKAVSSARHDLWWRLRTFYGWSYVEIGRLFDRNHTTVLHGVRAWSKASGARSLALPQAA